MKYKFSQIEVEGHLNNCLIYGDEAELAKRLDRSPGLISQMLNVNDERASDFYKALKFVCAELDINQCRGRAVLQLFNLIAERHVDREIESCPNLEAAGFAKEFAEAIGARLCDKPPHEQIKEIDDVVYAAERLKKSILPEHENQIKFSNGFLGDNF